MFAQLPLYLSDRHAKNLGAHERHIALLCMNSKLYAIAIALPPPHLDSTCVCRQTKYVFNPNMVLKVLPALLNTMVSTRFLLSFVLAVLGA